MATQDKWTGAWLFDFYHASGEVNLATRDFPDDSATLGAVYKGLCLTPQMAITSQLEDGLYGVDVPSRITGVRFKTRTKNATTGAWDVHMNTSWEWRECPVRVRFYDWESGTLTEEFHGEVTDQDPIKGDIVLSFESVGSRILDTLIPTQVVESDDFGTATDLGAAIPVAFGNECIIKPAFVGFADTADSTDPGGRDYLVSWHDGCRVLNVFGDTDRAQAGLDSMEATWTAAPGSPTHASSTTFTVSGGGDLGFWYGEGQGGLPIRYKTTASPTDYVYDRIESYSAGTVTVQKGPLDAGLTSVEIAPDFLIQVGEYQVSGQDMTSIRVRTGVRGGLLVQCKDARNTGATPFTNPVHIIQEILENQYWGLNQTCNATSFGAAATAVTLLWSGYTVDWALGWDGRQRTARKVLNSLLRLIEGRLTYDATAEEWLISVDMVAPSAATLTFGYGDGTYNNCEPVSNASTPSSKAISNLKLRFCPAGRDDGDSFKRRDYQYTIGKDVLSVGKPKVETTDLLRDIDSAKQTLDRWAKRILYGDQKPVIMCGQEARTVALGDLVTYTNTPDNIDASFQVHKIEKRLDGIKLYLQGYNSAIYDDDSGDIASPAVAEREETTSRPVSPTNLLRSPDFSTGKRAEDFPAGTADYSSVPGWYIQDTGGMLSAGDIVTDYACIGGQYLEITGAGTDGNFASNVPRLTAVNTLGDPSGDVSGFACVPGESFWFSIYANQTMGFRFRVWWYYYVGGIPTFIVTHNPHIRFNGADTNGKGWQRYFSMVRAPALAEYCYPEVVLQTAGTYKFDAAQYELGFRGMVRPSNWSRAVRFGVDPQQINPGELALRPSGSDADMKEVLFGRESAVTALTGLSEVNLLGADDSAEMFKAGETCRAVLSTISTGITYGGGGASYKLGTSLFETAFASACTDTAQGEGTLANEGDKQGYLDFKSDTHLVAKTDAGTWTAGELHCVAYMTRYTRPSS